MMATSERQLLIWKLQKKLPGLDFNQLQTVAREVGNTQKEKTVCGRRFYEEQGAQGQGR